MSNYKELQLQYFYDSDIQSKTAITYFKQVIYWPVTHYLYEINTTEICNNIFVASFSEYFKLYSGTNCV